MSRARKLRRVVRWARYVNRYAHIPHVAIGGQGATRAVWSGLFGATWGRVRRQAKHRYRTQPLRDSAQRLETDSPRNSAPGHQEGDTKQ